MGTIQCKKCGDILSSKHRHDFQMCSCKSCYIDGGDVYFRMGYHNINDVIILDEGGKKSENNSL